jgi:hypothetical protein
MCAALLGCSGDGEDEPVSATAQNRPSAPALENESTQYRDDGAGVMNAAGGSVSRAEAATAPDSRGESCSGCARFSVPLNAGDQFGMFELSLPEPVDMTDTTITWRLRAIGFEGTSGGVSPYVRDAQDRDQCFIWTNLAAIPTWTDVDCEFSERYPGGAEDEPFHNDFDRTRVEKLGIQIHSGSSDPSAVYSDALVYLDSISFSNRVSPDITFDIDIANFEFLPGDSTTPAGTNVTYLGK